MRGNIRKWCALGVLASAALVYPGCKSDSRDPLNTRDTMDSRTPSQAYIPKGDMDRSGMSTEKSDGTIIVNDSQAGLGGSGLNNDLNSEEMGTGGSGKAAPMKKGKGSMAHDAGTPMMHDAGMGGAGFDPSAIPETPDNAGSSNSDSIPAK